MTKTRKMGMMLLVTFLISCVIFAGAVFITDNASKDKGTSDSVQNGVSDALITLLDATTDHGSEAEVKGERRLTQKLTVITEDGSLSVSGTVTKAQDAFYPGTYEIKFGHNAILSSKATVQVSMDVKRGEKVYILIGDRDKGYTEYASVVAVENNKVAFSTNILQDYTLSTTDISGAQEAMAGIFSAGYGN